MSDTGAGEAFRPGPDDARDGGDRHDPFRAAPVSVWELVGDDLAGEVDDWRHAMRTLGGAISSALATQAEETILVAALNDGVALVDHVGRRDGRSAAHSARALFEHLVNMRDVQASPVNTPERFEEHKHVLADQVSRRRWYLPLLTDAARRREVKRLDRMGRAAAGPLAAALGKYQGFHLGWAEGGLRARVEAHDLGSAHEGYRILTAMVQGSSSLAGVTRQAGDATEVKVGVDLDLAATAYAEGLSILSQFFDGLEDSAGDDAEELRARTESLLAGLPQVRDALKRVDEEMSGVTPPPLPPARVAVVGLYPNGRRRWYLYDPQGETVIVANPPAVEPDLAHAIALLEGDDPASRGGRPITMTFEDIKVAPRPGAVAVPAGTILVPAGHPARLAEPRVFRPIPG